MTDLSVSKKPAHQPEYKAKNKIRFVTAASLFDGHDASINIMRRILQGSGCEVIHLGHNRSVNEVVTAALQEDVQGIAISSYQGEHVEYFKYAIDLLRERGGANIKVFGGGGGVIVPEEIAALHAYGVTRIYTPEDGCCARTRACCSNSRGNVSNVPPGMFIAPHCRTPKPGPFLGAFRSMPPYPSAAKASGLILDEKNDSLSALHMPFRQVASPLWVPRARPLRTSLAGSGRLAASFNPGTS